MEKTGKAQSLEKLHKGGFMVPAFFVCDKDWSEKRVLEKIKAALPKSQYFAVRSSAENEDSKEKSFAGHFYTGIGVAKKDVYAEIAKVRQSFGRVPGSIIVQDFISSDMAGVMFTEVNKNATVINATLGLCQSVVSGEACDEYLCNKDGALLKKTIPKEKTVTFFVAGKVISDKSEKESLNIVQIKRLIQLATDIQRFFGSPQDIEWCFKNNELYVLQSRPITKDFAVGEQTYFDSANIAESYSGIVLPLTCTFAKMVYEQVYKDLLHWSGVPRSKAERHSYVFENLLGFFYGRMYYNMNNWYRMAEFLPGYRRNKDNFELMITSNIKQEVAISIKPSIALTVLYPFIVATKAAVFGITSAYFKSNVGKHLRWLRNHDFEHLTYAECINLFNNLNENLLRRWYVTLENDFFVMTYLGILKKMLSEDHLQKALVFPSKATEQVTALAFLSKKMSEAEPLWKAIESDDVETFNRELTHNSKAKIALDGYLHAFGGRFANELKLESIGVDEDTKKLFAVLKAYRNYIPRPTITNFDPPLPLFKKIIAKIVLRKFKKYAARREEFRLLRSNTFAMVRRLFRQMGALLAEKKILNHPDDIFYLHLEEILKPATETNRNLLKIAEERKQEYSSFKKTSPPTHFSTAGNQPPVIDISTNLKTQTIYGRPASPGTIRGKVKVFREFSMPDHVDFDILVTSHTDPGWTSLIALSKGLIIEHGGVLSHASIVARELGIPAVIGASGAMDIIPDYQMVEIDGSSGAIKLL
ncbi:MAG: Pyruvate phosphate dikinase PEP/pyruvate-binding protein [Candidatus Levybacteria bacterium GW2011_GWB1_41_21]|uniref:Pyruvate phosphate dikinase PEP/pyruvate-binding protein n=1 Tax=Candidatus Giovannonibacteria bacterium GW2011_GWA1_44_25 TaxID=1618645 RepID=A0A0G1IK39_9BACT|nr:MAG: Pyruvate phosphate dikinase PEP/pyruvate-binding protein [Microgenomates group bacterium GW2011_GWC1_38_14]KKS01306.1 MAG: Pyruvate phosphate dikinase PEP/pyruvate-binding protein [Candidatus Levybacteria bacterium GW2011_GWB1_41_21]KKT59223.1 MAG: Pyruvate phosphate dikinase PEP/pyruvate-binding protein [Candidatus Giovannonibacteria bacterium GW2011_GWA1_44_25]